MTRVLPEPAPARINKGPSPVVTASRCCGLSCERKSVMKMFTRTFKHTDQFAQTLRFTSFDCLISGGGNFSHPIGFSFRNAIEPLITTNFEQIAAAAETFAAKEVRSLARLE